MRSILLDENIDEAEMKKIFLQSILMKTTTF